MSDRRSTTASDDLDALGCRAADVARAAAEGRVANLPEADRLTARSGRRRTIRLTAVVSAAVVVLLGAALVQARTRAEVRVVDAAATGSDGTAPVAETDPPDQASTTPQPPTPQPSTAPPPTVRSVEDILDPIYASGWLPYDGDDVLHPEPGGVPQLKGYARYGENLAPGKAPIYDAPDGTVIGYAYSQLGFVALADDATFDASAERTARYGCDGFQDPTCEPVGLGAPPG